MKNLLLIAIALFTGTTIAQTLTYEDLQTDRKPKAKGIVEYVASNGEVFKVGDKVTLGLPSNQSEVFMYVAETDGWAIFQQATRASAGWESEIIKFKVMGTKRAGWQVVIVGKASYGGYRLNITIEEALKFNEIVSGVMTREEAIAKLKESKDLLDLGLLTQSEYDKIKAELTPIIMQE